MSDPKRWTEIEGEEGAMLARDLAKVEPSAEIRERVWSKVAATLPPTPTSGSAGSEGAGGGATAAAGAKIALGAIAALGAGALVVWAVSRPPVDRAAASAPSATLASAPRDERTAATESSTSAASDAASASAEPVATAAPSASARPHREEASARPPVGSSPGRSPSANDPDRLREETEGVRKVRQLLREKRPGEALAELDRLSTRFPAGPLEEEREVLAIEALAAAGRADAARVRAARFLEERPASVHRARVRAIAGR